MGREQRRISVDALDQRPGPGRPRRVALPPRRGDCGDMEPDAGGPRDTPCRCQVRHGAGIHRVATEWPWSSSPGCASSCRPTIRSRSSKLRARNHENRPRATLTATYYARWLLGCIFSAPGNAPVVVNYDAPTRSIRFAPTITGTPTFPTVAGFLTSDREPHGLTADRTEFLGREGRPERPRALRSGLA